MIAGRPASGMTFISSPANIQPRNAQISTRDRSASESARGPGIIGCVGWFDEFSLFIVLLTESSRVPVDDPATHLELTMIHEVMILDHSGPDLAFIELGAALKLFFFSTLITLLVLPALARAFMQRKEA